MVAAQKVESKNEEIQVKVRARAAVATDSGEGTMDLGQQIAKLMAALTKVGQGSSPASAPRSPRREAMEGDMQTGVLSAAPAPTMAGLVLDRLPWTTAHLLAAGQGLPYVEIKGRAVTGLMLGMKVNQQEGSQLTPVF